MNSDVFVPDGFVDRPFRRNCFFVFYGLHLILN